MSGHHPWSEIKHKGVDTPESEARKAEYLRQIDAELAAAEADGADDASRDGGESAAE